MAEAQTESKTETLHTEMSRADKKCRVEGCTKIGAGHWCRLLRPAVVELPAIREAMLAIEQKEIRRARGAKTFGDFLAVVLQVRE